MLKPKMYKFYNIRFANYDFNLCKEKEVFLKILETSIPKAVTRFNKKGTRWALGSDYHLDDYYFGVNGGEIYINTCMESIDTFLDFLLYIAYYDNKDLMCTIEYEGNYQEITAIPLGNNKIRFTVFEYDFPQTKNILSDIIIDKTVLLKQFRNILILLTKDMEKVPKDSDAYYEDPKTGERYYYDKYLVEQCINDLTKYLNNPQIFKDTFILPDFIRVFNIGYKDLEGNWQFTLCSTDDEKCNPEYWKELKRVGQILDYDIDEQYPECGYNNGVYLGINAVKNDIENNYTKIFDMETRVDELNWCYSNETQKWYSTEEVMPKPSINPIIFENEKFDIVIKLTNYCDEDDEEESIENYIYKKEWLNLTIKIKNTSSEYELEEINYSEPSELEDFQKLLSQIKTEKYFREGNVVKTHYWNDFSSGKLYIARYYAKQNQYSSGNKTYTNNILEFYICVDKDQFITKINKELEGVEQKIKAVKNKKTILTTN